jgi:hypothetical protein
MLNFTVKIIMKLIFSKIAVLFLQIEKYNYAITFTILVNCPIIAFSFYLCRTG